MLSKDLMITQEHAEWELIAKGNAKVATKRAQAQQEEEEKVLVTGCPIVKPSRQQGWPAIPVAGELDSDHNTDRRDSNALDWSQRCQIADSLMRGYSDSKVVLPS